MVVVLALTAAALSAVSAAGQHRAASGLARRRRNVGRSAIPGAGLVLALLTTPLWLGSWALDVGAFFTQAWALHLGALSVVQPLMAATLLFTLPLAAADGRRWPSARDWAATVLLCGGLGLVLSARGGVDDSPAGPGGGLVPVLAALTALVVVLVVTSRGRSATVRAAMLGTAAGVLFGVGAATTKLTVATAAGGGLTGLLTSWPGYALAAASVASFVLQQSAYAVGSLATVMTAVVITDPLTSYVVGAVGFGERLPAAGAPLTMMAVGMLTLAIGVAVLARSPLLQPPPDVPSHQVRVAPAGSSSSTGVPPRTWRSRVVPARLSRPAQGRLAAVAWHGREVDRPARSSGQQLARGPAITDQCTPAPVCAPAV